MNFSKLSVARYSVRGYKPDPVEQEKLDQILETVRMAPSAANRQPFKLIVVPTEGRQEELRRIYNSEWFVQPPYVICACTIDSQAWKRQGDEQSYAWVDVAIAFDHLILAATELGLGTCWIASFDPAEARRVLRLSADLVPVLFTPLGYPNSAIPRKRRKPIDDLVEYFT